MGIWAFLVSVAFIPTFMSAAVVGRWVVIALGVPLVADIGFKMNPLVQTAIVMGIAWSAASVFIAPDLYDSVLQFYFMLLLFGVMGAASQQKSLDSALTAMCAGVGVSLLFCIPVWFGHPIVAQGSTGQISGVPNAAGLFYNSEVLTELAAPLVVWAVVKRRWWLAVLTVLPILANQSRIALFAVIFALAIAFWPKSWRARAAIVAAGLWIGIGGVIYMTLEPHRFASAALRATIWLSTVFAIDPLGHGLGWYRAAHTTEEFAHSDVLQAFAELGLGALAFTVIPIFALRNRSDHAERAAFIVVCIELVVSFPLHVPANAFLAALLAGYLVRDRACFRVIEPSGGSEDGPDGEWSAAIRGDTDWGSGRGRLAFPVRYSAERVSPVGSLRSGAAGA